MEPLAKRLRILQSVEVDETNPEYLAAKEKQRAKLRHKFESIFSKFEAIPDSMTDEIDMHTGEIVVDRGHMRRLDKEYQRRHHRRKGLLDDLMADDIGAGEEENEEDEGENSGRDELAPSKSPEPPRHRRQEKESNAPTMGQQGAQVSLSPPYTPSGNTSKSMEAVNAQTSQSGVPTSAMNWLNMVQFPQTPAGQQAQNAFMTQITQAVQQAIVPIISNILTHTPMAQYGTPTTQYTTPIAQQNHPVLPLQSAASLSIHAKSAEQNETLQKASDGVVAFASSPLPTKPTSPRQRRVARCVYIPPRRSTLNPTHTGVHEKHTAESNTKRDEVVEMVKSPIVASRPSARQRKEPATEPKQILHASNSRAFQASSTSERRHLPTPSSTDRGETKEREEKNAILEEGLDAIIASRDYFDDDERDLLSLADSNDSDQDLPEHEQTEDDAGTEDDLDPDGIILPSVEIEAPVEEGEGEDEDEEDEEDEEMEEHPIAKQHEASTETIARTAIVSSAVKQRISCTRQTHLEVNPNSKDGGLDLISASSPSNSKTTPNRPSKPLTKTISQTTLSSAVKKIAARKQPIHFQVDSESEDDGLDLVGASSPLKSTPKAKPSSKNLTCTAPDPLTPVHIKHEPMSPPSNLLFISSAKAPNTATTTAFQTPHSASRPFVLNGTRSVGGNANTPMTGTKNMSRSAFIKKVKQSWAREGRSGKGDGSRKRKSLLFGDASARKRSRVGDCDYDGVDSADELAG